MQIIKKIVFGERPFRMFKNLEVPISERLTVIAGHNGSGKSTLLGLIANGSELKSTFGKTLFNRAFQAQLHELFYLDEQRDYVEKRNQKPSFELHYENGSGNLLIKTCNVSKHSDKRKNEQRLKVVPRGSAEGWEVGNEAKVPIPTLFLSMSRMLPVGEFFETLNAQLEKKLDDIDRQYIREKFSTVISHKVADSSNITKHELAGTTKRSLLPEFDHSSRTISLGQDSLSSIITALASFNHLKRTWPNYQGGILLIDEIDAGFHPKAQVKMIQLLKKEAKDLKLQIIMTSHSLTIVKEVLAIRDETARSGRNIDSVVYIEDVISPHLMENVSYENIKRDMFNCFPVQEEKRPRLKIYFEDEEAKWIFSQIIKAEKIDLEALYQYDFVLVAAKLGCNNLKQLIQQDDYFKEIIVIFDGDVSLKPDVINMKAQIPTIAILPAKIPSDVKAEDDERLTPEYQIYSYLKSLTQNFDHPFWNNLPSGYHRENIVEEIINTFPLKSTDFGTQKPREVRKDWFNQHRSHFEAINLFTYLVQDLRNEINPFLNDLKSGISYLIDKRDESTRNA
ncbi:MAG: hypothetical protein BHV69_02350 [Bacteroidales bacterium 52_46]|nr:MAG: hypothetical protein BHV69_02350 [Bacteroidales bacterium 52_46]